MLTANSYRLAAAGAVLVYTTGFLLWYSATPLGLHPVLDGREMLALAGRIAAGTLSEEPFYRAALYPAVLSLLIDAGIPSSDLPLAARALNGVLHLVNTLLVWRIAGTLWGRQSASTVAALLYGLNPVALHFAADPLDITFAISLMLAGLHAGMSGIAATPKGGHLRLALASACLALAVLARPHMLTILFVWFLIVAIDVRPALTHSRSILAGLLPALIVLSAMGTVNHALSGEFRVLPWQSAYNLWSANRPGANGRYFEQSLRIASYDDETNPTRVESERLYRQLNPKAPADHATMSRFWRTQMLDHIVDAPLEWGVLLARKFYYLFNNFEQYNNKTYSFHKRRSPWLRWNPVCWALLLAGASAGLVLGWQRPGMQGLALCVAAYTAGLLITYMSARFRLPLVPILAIMAGGVATGAQHSPKLVHAVITASLLLGLSSIPIGRVEAERTYVQDYLLVARASAQSGQYDAAIRNARQALARAPRNEAALELTCVAGFNAWLYGAQPEQELTWLAEMCARAAPISPVAQRVVGIVYWRRGQNVDAVSLWSDLVRKGGPEVRTALAALLMTDYLGVDEVVVDWDQHESIDDMLLLALSIKGDARASDVLRWRMTPDEIEKQRQHLERTFTRPESFDDQ